MDFTVIQPSYDEYLYEVDSLLMLETGFPTTEAMLPDVYTGYQYGLTPGQCAHAVLDNHRRAA